MFFKLKLLFILFFFTSFFLTGNSQGKEDFELADGLFNRHIYKLALKEYQKLLIGAEKASQPRVYYSIASTLQKMGDKQSALSALNQLLVKYPESKEYYDRTLYKKAKILSELNRLKESIEQLQKIIASEKIEQKIKELSIIFCAELLVSKNRNEEAVEILKKIALLPFNTSLPYRQRACFSLARIYQSSGKLKEAAELFSRLMTNKNIHQKIKSMSLFALGTTYYALEDYKKAAGFYEQFIFDYPKQEQTVRAYIKWICCLFNTQEYAKALQIINKSDKYSLLQEEKYEILLLKGNALFYLEHFEKASSIYNALLNIPAGKRYHISAKEQLLYCLIKQEKYSEYIKNYQKQQTKTSIENANLLFFAGLSSYNLKSYSEAISYFQKSIKISTATWNYSIKAHEMLANSFDKRKEYDKSVEVYMKLAKQTNNTDYSINVADKFILSGNHDKAEKVLSEILQNKKIRDITKIKKIRIRLAELLINKDKLNEAEKILEKNIIKASETEDYLAYLLGYIKFYLKKYSDAKEYFKVSKNTSKDSQKTLSSFFLGYTLCKMTPSEKNGIDMLNNIFIKKTIHWPKLDNHILMDTAGILYTHKRYESAAKIYKKLEESKKISNSSIKNKIKIKLAETMFYSGKKEIAIKQLFELLKYEKKKEKQVEIKSILGEFLIKTGKKDMAVSMFEGVLRGKERNEDTSIRASYGLAKIFFNDKRYETALPYITTCFVIYNNKKYTPKAMLLATKIFYELKNKEQALITWKELSERYPIKTELYKKNDFYKNKIIPCLK